MDIRVFKRLDTDFYTFIGDDEKSLFVNEFNIKESEYDWICSFDEVYKDCPKWVLSMHIEATVLKDLK